MGMLYAIPTSYCNLSCPHCFIHEKSEVYNREQFLKQLNDFDGEIILFGGEPTIYQERMMDIVNDNLINGKGKIGGISTNLIILNEELIEFYKRIKHVATSWNLRRFTPDQYETWLSNCKRLKDNGLTVSILVTLTNDLIELDPSHFIKTVSQWDPESIHHIKFEHYIGEDNTLEYYHNADQWLSNLYRKWDSPIKVRTFEDVDNWYYDCSDTYTLFPDGTLVNSCPNGVYGKRYVTTECFTCHQCDKCRPCKLQKFCSYPKLLYKTIHSKKEEL